MSRPFLMILAKDDFSAATRGGLLNKGTRRF
jgi:hypothetical protein